MSDVFFYIDIVVIELMYQKMVFTVLESLTNGLKQTNKKKETNKQTIELSIKQTIKSLFSWLSTNLL